MKCSVVLGLQTAKNGFLTFLPTFPDKNGVYATTFHWTRVNANVELCFVIGQCHGNSALFDVGVDGAFSETSFALCQLQSQTLRLLLSSWWCWQCGRVWNQQTNQPTNQPTHTHTHTHTHTQLPHSQDQENPSASLDNIFQGVPTVG